MEDKRDNCVSLNIYVNCNKCKEREKKEYQPCQLADKERDDNENCIEINVYVECDKKKSGHYTF